MLFFKLLEPYFLLQRNKELAKTNAKPELFLSLYILLIELVFFSFYVFFLHFSHFREPICLVDPFTPILAP